MITIKSFKNAKQALVYKTAFENASKLESITSNHTSFFIVSYMNYALFYKGKDHVNYQRWATVKYQDL